VVVDRRTVLDLLDLDRVLLLACRPRLLLLLEPEAPEVHDAADDGAGVGGDFDEVESAFLRHAQRVFNGDDADLATFLVDQADGEK